MESHHKMFLDFTKIRELINEEKRSDTIHSVIDLLQKVFDYNLFVENHQARTGDNFFLYYPSCAPGHYVFLENKVLELSFNPKRTWDNANEEIKHLLSLNHVFGNRDSKFPRNILDPNGYHRNIELVKQQLNDVFKFKF